MIGDVPSFVVTEFLGETPDGHYLAELKRIDEEYTVSFEATYLPLVQPLSDTVSGSRYKKVYDSTFGFSANSIHIMYIWLWGRFTYDGYTSECIDADSEIQYIYNNIANGGFGATNVTCVAACRGSNATAYIGYDWYQGSTHLRYTETTVSITCSSEGVISG